MSLSVEELRRVSALLDELLERSPAERLDWLAKQEDVAPRLREHLQGLLEQADAVPFTLPPLPQYPDEAEADDGLTAGTELGAYRLLSKLGRGGMGSVWLAERTDGMVKRRVALKLPHSNLPLRQLVDRFGRERDILAGLEHPNIARLYDAGVAADGRPYLALEYVEGRPLHDYCRMHALGLKDRLELFLQVLAAVQFAHGRLIVHRDIKPSNILVSDDGQVHLLDFGIAKLLVAGQVEDSELTQLGGRAMTPRYAAPEQILQQPLGTATDVYSLGVVLYELLAGSPPYRLKRGTPGDLERAILDTEPTLVSAAAAPDASWAQRLKGDLDTILLKALKKRPEERYATAAAFAEDIQRYLRGEPVTARADSTWYRAGKFINRHRVAVVAASLAILALVAGFGVALWQANVAKAQSEFARAQSELARTEAVTAQAVTEFVLDIFRTNSRIQEDPVKARATTARELLDIGAAKIERSLERAPQAKATVYQALMEMYGQIGMPERAAELAERYVELAKTLYARDSKEVFEGTGMLALTLGMTAPGGDRLRQVIDELHTMVPAGDEERAAVASHLESVYWQERDFRRAVDFSHAAAGFYRRHDESAQPLRHDSDTRQWIVHAAAEIDMLAGDCASAYRWAQFGLTQYDPKPEADVDQRVRLRGVMGRAAWCLQQTAEAERDLREYALATGKKAGDQDISSAVAWATLADFLLETGRRKEGLEYLAKAEQAMDHGLRISLGNPNRVRARLEFARAMRAAGRPGEALKIYAQAETEAKTYCGEGSLTLAKLYRGQAAALLALKQGPSARQALDQAVAIRERAGVSAEPFLKEEAAIRDGLGRLGR